MTRNVQLALPREFCSYGLESPSEILYHRFVVKEHCYTAKVFKYFCKECHCFGDLSALLLYS